MSDVIDLKPRRRLGRRLETLVAEAESVSGCAAWATLEARRQAYKQRHAGEKARAELTRCVDAMVRAYGSTFTAEWLAVELTRVRNPVQPTD